MLGAGVVLSWRMVPSRRHFTPSRSSVGRTQRQGLTLEMHVRVRDMPQQLSSNDKSRGSNNERTHEVYLWPYRIQYGVVEMRYRFLALCFRSEDLKVFPWRPVVKVCGVCLRMSHDSIRHGDTTHL